MIGLILWAWRTRRRLAEGLLPGWDTPQGEHALAMLLAWHRVERRAKRRG